jgi:DNA polymerase-3 subunit gamma/tau
MPRDNSLPLHIKYRPRKLEEMVGNSEAIDVLKTVLDPRRPAKPHAFLFTGPSGCGKTTLARIVKTELGCSDRDYLELDGSKFRGIDTIRDLADQCRYAPLAGKVRVYLLDECHQLTKDAQNALLKMLEEPPSHVYFLLATTDPESLINTIRTRCTIVPVRVVLPPMMIRYLQYVLEQENVTNFPVEALAAIAHVSGGSPRAAMVALDRVIDIADDGRVMAAIEDLQVREVDVVDLCQALLKHSGWPVVRDMLKNIANEDVESTRRGVLGYLSAVLLKEDKRDDVAEMMMYFTDNMMYSGRGALVLAFYAASKVTK